MSVTQLTENTTENYLYFQRFKKGEEEALNYVYKQVFKALEWHGKKIIEDEFVVKTLVQDAILKGWQFREQMESLFHAYCFMRINLRWSCLSYYKNQSNQFHQRIIHMHDDTDYADRSVETEQLRHFDEDRLQLVEAVIPYLPLNSQTIMDLHFRKGLSLKRIARRFGSSHQGIHLEVQKSIDHLKKMIEASKSMKSKNPRLQEDTPGYEECMDAQMWELFKLRYEQKLGFDTIAAKMNLSIPYVLQQYSEAHKRIKTLKRK